MTDSSSEVTVVQFNDLAHRAGVVSLWNTVFGYATAHNEPNLVIDKKTATGDGLLLVALLEGDVVGTVIAGYDGHRGWIYSLAVAPDNQHSGCGSKLMKEAENLLSGLGCLKVNLQIMEGNEQVRGFYEAIGYTVEKRVSMGKRLPA